VTKILDTTLRDGSYVVDFQINARQTHDICEAVDSLGFDYIEIGHGLGMQATNIPSMKGAATDEEYLEAASSAIRKAIWGTFFIPGIASTKDIELAAKYKMPMIRIGANVNEYDRAAESIAFAKNKGMFVCANFMKTYALPYHEVGEIAAQAAAMGADLVCIVDSAGAMLPDDVEGYIKAIRNSTDAQIGFHGHNNLGMAIWNSVVAFNHGVDVIDTSLRGMGRSAGNTVSEIFLLTLKRLGHDLGYDLIAMMDAAEKHIDPLMKGYTQVDSYSILSGYAKFHSSFQPKIEAFAKEYDIDPRRLILALCEQNVLNAPDDLLEALCKELSKLTVK
jgi:4-hydroxy-2-oxovalerate aldolase